MTFIPYGRQHIDKQDIQIVIDVLQSDYLTQGPLVPKFEEKLKSFCQTKYAYVVCNATAALHLACLVLNVGKNDIVWTTPNTFVASANCALYCGAKIDFVDICPKTYNMSVEALENKLIKAAKNKKLPKVVIPVDFAGQSCNMRKIKELSDQYGFKIIEDASHAIGGKYLDQPIGNCQYSDITVFSFHPVKIITTGEGGALLTNHAHLAKKITLLRTHGVTRDVELIQNTNEGAWYYEQIDLGYNYRITDIQCALGISQLEKLANFVMKRHRIADRYHKLLQSFPIITPYQSNDSYSSFHLYPIQLHNSKNRRHVFNHLRQKNIGVNVHYIPVYLQPYYKKMGFKNNYCEEAEKYYSNAMSLPIYPDLTEEQQNFIVSTLTEII